MKGKGTDRWGYLIMCVLCAAVIVFSALWTRVADEEENLRDAAGSLDESVSDAGYRDGAAQTPSWARPCDGTVVRGYSGDILYFEPAGVWHTHPAADFAAQPGDPVRAVRAGTVTAAREGQVILDHGDGKSVYRGLAVISCRVGQSVAAGQALGAAGADVPFEGSGFVCVTLTDETGKAIDGAALWDGAAP